MHVKANHKPSKREREEFLQFMRTEQIGQLVIHVEGDEDMVLTVEQKDAEGRTLLRD